MVASVGRRREGTCSGRERPTIRRMPQGEKALGSEALERAARADAAASRPWTMAATGAVFLLIAGLICADYLGDTQGHDPRVHAAIELTLMAVAVGAGILFWSRFVALRRRERLLRRDLEGARADAERWKQEASELLRGLGAAIDTQFDRWALSAAEREVALLLLKGLSHKEVAEVRHTSEKTVRQQSLSVYRKAGLSGRAELSAFFLEDLLLPAVRPADAARR
jgi:DNA-binding CsgD family transcriptional regulator